MIKAFIVNKDGTYEETSNKGKYIDPDFINTEEYQKVEKYVNEIKQKEIWYWCNECKETLGKADITDDCCCKKHGTKVYDLRNYYD